MRVISSSLACNDEMLETDGKAEGHLMVKSTRPPVDRPPFFCTILGDVEVSQRGCLIKSYKLLPAFMEHHRNSASRSYLKQQLQESYTELHIIRERQEKQVHYHETRARNLTIGYLILQAIYLNAVSQRSTALQCRNWWAIFAISFSASVVYFINFLDAVSKFYWTQYNVDVNQIEWETLRARIREASDETKGHCKIQVDGDLGDPVLLFKRKLCISITCLALIAITGFELYACRSFLY
ncbi:hypothetical protein CJ030_MR2G022298 [Morella rubra]|uniref:Uncharacterized protein n=1 Tax=Morella rubra TaxID=262757 RepID=A0A6A1WG08_9ROSI|nr:hypothetical protein CJ030_MR2G022298 [Morella rubra]